MSATMQALKTMKFPRRFQFKVVSFWDVRIYVRNASFVLAFTSKEPSFT